LLSVFLTPIAVKTIHIHEHRSVCTEKHDRHFHKQAEKCDICDFVFSLFTSESDNDGCKIDNFVDYYCNLYSSVVLNNSFYLNILLRAPPVNNFNTVFYS